MSIDEQLLQLGDRLRAEGIAIGTSELLDAFAAQDVAGLPPEARTELVHGIAASSPLPPRP